MEDNDNVYVICHSVKNAPNIPGCTRDTCSECKEQVWISPATRAKKESLNSKAAVLCIHCAGPLLAQQGQHTMMPPSEAQIEEIKAYQKSQEVAKAGRASSAPKGEWVRDNRMRP